MRLFFLVLLFSTSAFAQVNPWVGLNVQKKLNSHYSLMWENQYRLFEGSYSELQWRVGALYKITPHWSMAAGGFTSFNKDVTLQEFRPWQQLVYQQEKNHWSLAVRFRQEQRIFTLTDEFSHRLRLQVRINYQASNSFTPYATTEFFLGIKESPEANFPSGYNQNRTQLGILTKLTKEISLETSLMRVYNKGIKSSTENNVLWNSFQVRF